MLVNSAKQIARVFGVECWREKRAKQNLPRELKRWQVISKAEFVGIVITELRRLA